MMALPLTKMGSPLTILCIGAHSDDIEIGAGATILGLMASGHDVVAHWVVLSASGRRGQEATASAQDFLQGAAESHIEVNTFRDGYFPYEAAAVKDYMGGLSRRISPDIVFTHHRDDAHQDHRLVAELTGNHFRDTLTLAYEIPKWDGDLGRPNVYLPIARDILDRKIALLEQHFATQRSKDWFDGETFRGLARIRGMECRAPDRFAEGFHCNKLALSLH
ncbi:MAG: PIG-L deacetylase family protein [Hyphomicrobiaceae bacterium]